MEVARQLARLGVDVIEAGFPFRRRAILKPSSGLPAKSMARSSPALPAPRSRILTAPGKPSKTAERPRIHVFISIIAIFILSICST